MFEHLAKNRFWFWKAMETYGLGIYFIIKHNTFAFEPPQPTLLDVLVYWNITAVFQCFKLPYKSRG